MSSTIDSPKSVASIRKLTSGKKASYEAVWFDKRTQADSHEPNEATPDVQMGDSYRELSETPSKVRQSLAGKQHVVSKLQEIDDLDHAKEYFKMVLLLAFRESSRIMKESCSNHGQEYVADKKARKHLQYQMAHNTLLIAALRCVMVEKYGRAELYGHAIALCVGVLEQGLDHQSIQEYIETVVSNGRVPLAGMVQVMRDRIKMAQDRFEERKNILETIENLQNDSRCNRAIDQKNLNSHFSKLNDKRSAGIALEYVKDSILVFKLFERSLPAETHRDHSLMGLAYRLEGRLEDALLHYKTAASMLHGTDTDSLCLALILNDIGVIRMMREEIDVAVQVLSQAVDAYRNVPPKKAKPCSMRVSLGLTQTLKNLGHCYVKLHQYKDAKGAYQSALEFQLSARRMQTTVTMSPVEESRLLKWVGVDEIHDTFRRLGRMNSFIGLYQDCLATFTNAIVDYHHHVVEEDPNYMPKHGPIALVKTLLSTAEACSDFGQYARALGIYSQIQNIATRFERENPTPTLRCQVFRPMSCFGLASVHVRRLAYEDAHKLYKRALNFLDTECTWPQFFVWISSPLESLMIHSETA